jgi:hypothetical protein
MSLLPRILVVGDDRRTVEAVRLGFERDGFSVTAAPAIEPASVDARLGLIVASATGADVALSSLRQAAAVRGGGFEVPVLYVGNGVGRGPAITAGADEVIEHPAFVRDVVTIGRLMANHPADVRGHWVGQLADSVGVYYLVRAISSLGRSGVLTMSRGLRRGEVRFYQGEVTSAQVGGLHGQAALHQVLLWTDGRFDFRREDVVRRRQIPLPPDELFADAERFLNGVREVSGGLSPAMVFEQDPKQLANQAKSVPTEVHGVLRMFDGNRTLADVLEDSPYRVFETMRVVSKAVQAGLLRRVNVERPKSTFRAVLALEEWLVGLSKTEAVDRVSSLTDSSSSHPAMKAQTNQHRSGRRRKRRPPPARSQPAPAPAATSTQIDWDALVPRGVAVEMHGLSQVVPTMQASGEIVVPREVPATRTTQREGLEALTDPNARDRLFPSDTRDIDNDTTTPTIKVTFEPEPAPPVLPPKPDIEDATRARRSSVEAAVARAPATATDPPPAAPAASSAESVAALAEAKAQAEQAARAQIEHDSLDATGQWEKAEAEQASAIEKRRAEVAQAEARIREQLAERADRVRRETGDIEVPGRRKSRAEQEAEAVARARDAAERADRAKEAEPLIQEQLARDQAEKAARDALERETSERIAREQVAMQAAVTAEAAAEAAEQRARDDAARRAREIERQAREEIERAVREREAREARETAEKMAREAREDAERQAREAADRDARAVAEQMVRDAAARGAAAKAEAEAKLHAELAERGRVEAEARVRAKAEADAKTAAAAAATAEAERDAAPTPIADQPTGPVRRATATSKVSGPDADGVRSGELGGPNRRPSQPPPDIAPPAILVEDIAAAQAAVSKVTATEAAKPATPSAADDARAKRDSANVSGIRRDARDAVATAFSDLEEDFFAAGSSPTYGQPTEPTENFTDLDDGYEPTGFWDKLLGKKKKKR